MMSLSFSTLMWHLFVFSMLLTSQSMYIHSHSTTINVMKYVHFPKHQCNQNGQKIRYMEGQYICCQHHQHVLIMNIISIAVVLRDYQDVISLHVGVHKEPNQYVVNQLAVNLIHIFVIYSKYLYVAILR